MGRIIGISYRIKKTAKNEERPTMVAIKDGDKVVEYKLKTEDDELDFSKCRFPISYRKVIEGEDISVFSRHHCHWRKVKSEEDLSQLNPVHLRRVQTERGEQVEVCTEVPVEFDGLKEGDKIAMALGASNMLAGLLFVKGKRVSVKVYRIPPMYLQEHRTDSDKDQDHINLRVLLEQKAHLFYEVRQPDKDLIDVAVKLDLRQQAQKERIAYGNRLRQSFVGRTFLDEEEDLKELIKDRCEALMVNDVAYAALLDEEERRNKELEATVKNTDVWQIFEPIPGVGPRIAAGIISCIGDIRRFMVPVDFTGAGTQEEQQRRRQKALEKGAAKLMKFCGVHTLPKDPNNPQDSNRVFARRRSGEVANWSPQARQALYLLADQFNRKPDSEWGKKLLQFKAAFRQKHPEPVEVESSSNGKRGKKKKVMRYTDGHILRMAKWRTLTRFVRWLYKQWVRIETRDLEQ